MPIKPILPINPIKLLLLACALGFAPSLMAQSTVDVGTKARTRLEALFASWPMPDKQQPHAQLQSVSANPATTTVTVTVNDAFAQQPFTNKSVNKIYHKVRSTLPHALNKYKVVVLTTGMPIEQLVPDAEVQYQGVSRLWGDINYKGKPWVQNASHPYTITKGLQNRHITVWASHGRYYDNKHDKWVWQRPVFYGTTEDLFTQTIVVPYLIPMLQNAGAVVFTPRERDWQTREYIVDPDGSLNTPESGYTEQSNGKQWEQAPGLRGFAAHAGSYTDGENAFTAGHVQQVETTRKAGRSIAIYKPTFEQAGRYAVYVSYATVTGSVSDAHYIVYHQGVPTEFRVNQQMGGSTWVYLGTFYFGAGSSVDNCVMLTNQSAQHGVVTADAVRFGGGMGNIRRGGDVSNLPRCLEGARYSAQWAGAPYTVYSSKNGQDDYGDDINTRSLMENWLGGGSVYMPATKGQGVPFELSLAVHSDAGYSADYQSIVGSLAIATTNFNGGRFSSGVSRQASLLLADSLLNCVNSDMSRQFGAWNKRYLWDRNYSETRLPDVPSAILETMSHQNFPDMKLGQDPNFRFALARSVYRTLLHYICRQHGTVAITEPLAPLNPAVQLLQRGNAQLTWQSQPDSLDATARPTGYVVYTAEGSQGFDNGRLCFSNHLNMQLKPGVLYHFKVTAVNRGGESFPSAVVSALYQPDSKTTVLVVDGFDRLSSPAVIDDDTRQGFDFSADMGVSYGLTAGWSGAQTCFNKQTIGREGPGAMGYGGSEWVGHFVMGNQFDNVREHARALAASARYSIASCTAGAVEAGLVKLGNYKAVDWVLGLQKYEPWQTRYYKTFSAVERHQVATYMAAGGRMLVSGAYVGSDLSSDSERQWLRTTLHVDAAGSLSTDTVSTATGLQQQMRLIATPNPQHYAVQHADVLQPVGNAFCAMQYANGATAAVACQGTGASFVMGFPLECISDATTRTRIMAGVMNYLLGSSK